MTITQIPQEEFSGRLPFRPPENPAPFASNFRLQDCHIEKWINHLGEKGLFGGPYLEEYLYDRKRRNCRLNTLRGYFTTLMVFLSYL